MKTERLAAIGIRRSGEKRFTIKTEKFDFCHSCNDELYGWFENCPKCGNKLTGKEQPSNPRLFKTPAINYGNLINGSAKR